MRFEETDYYHAHASTTAQRLLPDGALLTALHAYMSKLYNQTAGPEDEKTWKCMDETALIAFGVLVEETAKELLGETGDLAFTEAAAVGDESPTESPSDRLPARERSDSRSSGGNSRDTTEESG